MSVRSRARLRPRRRTAFGRTLRALRPFILLVILVIVWRSADPAIVAPPSFLSTGTERVAETFTRCGPGRGHACVIDGDTFKLGGRKVRVIGIDAPEVHGFQCPEEARLGELATARLQALLNQGPFEMNGWAGDSRDQYGRDLRALSRTRADGTVQSIDEAMISSGLAHRYLGFKRNWC